MPASQPSPASQAAPTASTWAHQAFVQGQALVSRHEGTSLTVHHATVDTLSAWHLQETATGLELRHGGGPQGLPGEAHLLAALEASFARHEDHATLRLVIPTDERTAGWLDTGLLHAAPDRTLHASRDTLWQSPRLWVTAPREPYPLRLTLSQGRRHPQRPPKPSGLVYQRNIGWLGKTLSLRTVDLERDLPLINRWMNDPVVAAFWQEEGDIDKHRRYLDTIAADPHVIGLIGSFDGEPFGYFEVYWAQEDRLAPFYDAQTHDRGWHVLVGEARFRGKPFLTAWMPSISHYLFLDDCRTQRIVIEPRVDNHRMIRSLGRCGYALLKSFDFPHKRAMLGMLLRERFFNEALWLPRPDEPCAARPHSSESHHART